MKRKSLAQVAAAVVAAVLNVQGEPEGGMDLFEKFKSENAWNVGKGEFMEAAKQYGFRFLDGRETAASSNQKDALAFLGMTVYDTRVYFGTEGIRRVEVSLYNKGDAEKKLNQAGMEEAVKSIREKIDAAFGAGLAGRTLKPRANYVQQRYQWTKQSPAVQLEWAYGEPHRTGGVNVAYSAEYITVLMVPQTGKSAKDNAALTGEGIMAKAKNSGQLRTNVKTDGNGDVWIDNIPMVDQGQKGYCAAAASERILRYFGLNADEHQIAQLADTGAGAAGGTSLSGMAMAIDKIGRNYQLDKKDLIKIEDGKNFLKSDIMEQIEQYNAVARKKKKETIDWKEFAVNHTVEVQGIWAAMDPEILLESRMKQKQDYGAFLRNVKKYVDSGIPLLWSCLVGMYPETPELGAQGAFGHTRLIIGYNAKTDELIYSDTWGAAHAKKRMPNNQAWAMTKGLIVLKPRL